MLFREQESRQNIFRMLLLLVFVSCHLLLPAVDAAVTCWQGLIETAEVEKKVCDEDVKNCMRRHDSEYAYQNEKNTYEKEAS